MYMYMYYIAKKAFFYLLSIYLYIYIHIYLSIYLSITEKAFLYLISIYIYINIDIYIYIYLSIYVPSIYLSIYLYITEKAFFYLALDALRLSFRLHAALASLAFDIVFLTFSIRHIRIDLPTSLVLFFGSRILVCL